MSSRDGTDLTGRPEAAGDVARRDTAGKIDAFLDQAKSVSADRASGRARLIFALDATMSRQPTWDMACAVQARMFETAASIGGLDVQLVYFRGFAECRASRFVRDGRALTGLMTQIACQGGNTQIRRVLEHVRGEARVRPVGALVYVGDAMEEHLDALCGLAGEIGLLGVKAFMFHEGHDRAAETAFREIARLTGGAYARFDANAADQLAQLLRAAAAYAAGGRAALERLAHAEGGEAHRLLRQMK
ncbi:VWA domain-containing protein [Alsobacter sp. SYSU M60028]|uniref:VWA domain-containing protein n=1 Tax=Alsobacter ponti TaxID=2962936 RepID=A0ABT1LEF2_9HYPH|nr:VWA domain-containing protein [Alsobacter ponti]MCP8939885.1 VWA domain-containing protein [Alsobacter ponti]